MARPAAITVLVGAAVALTAGRLPLWQVLLIVVLVAMIGFGVEAFLDALTSDG